MDEEGFTPRIGTFFIILGIGSVLLFIISDIAKSIAFNYFFIGLLLIGIGIFFRRKAAKPPPSGRFSGLKKLNRKDKEEDEED
ncbi:MAG: hypothetical protein HN392_07125 [Anaerolineae bacterium]|jgi:hypothetical protein|nr:hypothetical protein [Anaerolineae bacterium]MBT7075924.1 hypothetical protein [Anaerolineae bacterium]MBT7783105.1 hypothetical protein [Anaerolineae bacterium]